MFKLCGKFIENLGAGRKRLKNCVMPWSLLAAAPWKRSRDPLAQAERRGSQSGHAAGEWLHWGESLPSHRDKHGF